MADALQQLQLNCSSIERVIPPDHGGQKELFPLVGDEVQQVLSARPFKGKVVRDWRMSSYSALTRHKGSQISEATELPGLDLEVVSEQNERKDRDELSIFTFPRGAHAGTFLHSVFEEISFNRYHRGNYAEQLTEQLVTSGFAEHWLEVIDSLLADVLATDLDGNGLSLGNIDDKDRFVEMEFMLSAEGVNPIDIGELIRRYDPLSASAGELEFEPLKGMLKGFIDLTFRHEGRYYILDYKSNHLGYESACYNQSAMCEAMADHRYDLQYLLYTLAIHRLLKQRIPHYSYSEHFGGVYYLFLRGVHPGSTDGVFSCRPDEVLINKLDQMFAGGVL